MIITTNELLVIRAVGFLLCAGMFFLGALWVPRERWVFVTCGVFWLAGAGAVLVRRFQGVTTYLDYLDIVLTPIIYTIALVMGAYLLRNYRRRE